MTNTTVTVDLHERSYPIVIGVEVLASLGERLRAMQVSRTVAIVTNPIVRQLYADAVVGGLTAAGFAATIIEIPAGEEHKNFAWLTFLYDRLLEARLDRNSAVVALGGGVIGDLTGFAAATFLRGVPYVQIPTTLLAQVDSSVGGKTGVNHPQGKNLVGAFYQPRLVLIDTETLHSLPRREFIAGLAEVIKYGVILSPDLFALLESDLARILALDSTVLREIIRVSCTLKALVVGEDERERGVRAILNFGHTLGHAIESLTEYKRYLHGEAIAIGMAFAARLSKVRGHCSEETVTRVVRVLKRAGLPVEIPREVVGRHLALAIEGDKKMSGGKIKFVCISEIGRTLFDQLGAAEIAQCVAR
ncbi:MAG: 3-dehydroquinate synthase [Deltaproteobacteria bacterium]|nr:3-dehydroquinate synthase [Deltaproteobacteria bacterium]MBI3389812.1 3-dehydroquinate synthase [Deltaproteobacteria bacterium]